MPGRGSYGSGGKWIYQRAGKLRAKNPDMSESASYAIATQQAHKLGKSNKGHRTPEGMAIAKAKYSKPVKAYRKTAGAKRSDPAMRALGKTATIGGEVHDARLYSNLRNAFKPREERVAAHKKLKQYKHKRVRDAISHGWSQGEKTKTAMWHGFADEIQKIALAPVGASAAGGGNPGGPAAAGPGPLPGGGSAPSQPMTGGDLGIPGSGSASSLGIPGGGGPSGGQAPPPTPPPSPQPMIGGAGAGSLLSPERNKGVGTGTLSSAESKEVARPSASEFGG